MGSDVRVKQQVSAAASLVSLVLGGGLLLQAIGVQSLLGILYHLITGRLPPRYFGLALGTTGAFLTLYHIAYVVVIVPAAYETHHQPPSSRLTLRRLTPIDFLVLAGMVGVYIAIVMETGTPVSVESMLGGTILLLTSLLFRLLPRLLVPYLGDDGFVGLRVVGVAIPVIAVSFLPAIYLVHRLAG